MARKRRNFIPTCLYHLTQRGIRQSDIFKEQRDRKVYIKAFKNACDKHSVQVISYCLMTNHVHFVLSSLSSDGISNVVQQAHHSYARYFNSTYGFSGHLFENRFFANLLGEDDYIMNAILYVEQNPVRAKIVDRPEKYLWSSARSRILNLNDPLLSDHVQNQKLFFVTMLSKTLSQEQLSEFRNRVKKGHPIASEGFCKAIEAKFGVNILPKKRGRKPKIRAI